MNDLVFFEEIQTLEKKDSPVLPTLCQSMNVDLVVNPNADVWLIHDKPFSLGLIWAEYDIDSASLYLVGKDGKIIDFGMKILPEMRKHLRHARQLFTLRMQNGEIDDSYILPLLVRVTGHYNA